MSQRFHIQELLTQDQTGVIYRAADKSAGGAVALQRFFPFGPEESGLTADEQTALAIAIDRLTRIRHRGLRSVLAGGSDPIDGIPWIATEWVEGEQLCDRLARTGTLEAAEAAALLGGALEVSGLLSEVLAEEAVWVDATPRAIVKDAGAAGREHTFALSPRHWLSGSRPAEGLRPILALAEEVLGWTRKVPTDQAAGGLGAWVKWLRLHADRTSLHEARENLAAAIGRQPPAPAEVIASEAHAPAGPALKIPSSRTPLVLSAAAFALVLAIAAFFFQRQKAAAHVVETVRPVLAEGSLEDLPESTVSASNSGETRPNRLTEAQLASAKAEECQRNLLNQQEAEADAKQAKLDALAARGGVFLASDRDLLMERENEDVEIEGQLQSIRSTKATIFFEFSTRAQADEPRGYLMLADAGPDMQAEVLQQAYEGKVVRLKGKVRVFSSRQCKRPEILISSPASIEVLD